jgi:hypothetical protein
MDVEHTKALVKFGNLRVLVEGAVDAANGTSDGVTRDLEELIQTLIAERFSCLDFSLAASKIRERCKVGQNWMPVGKALAKYIHRSYSTLDSMMSAAAKAQKLGDYLLAALTGEGVDPTEKKYDSLLDDLLGAGFSGTVSEARDVVRQALARFHAARKRNADERRLTRIAAEQEDPSRMRRILKERLRNVPPSNRNDAGLAIFREFANAVQAEFSDSILQYLLGQAQSEISLRNNHRRYTEHTKNGSLGRPVPTTAPAPTFDSISAAM